MPNYARARRPKPKPPPIETLPPFGKLFEQISPFPPIRVAVVWPDDEITFRSVWRAAQENIITPVLVGHEKRIRTFSRYRGLKMQNWKIHHTETSAAAAKYGVELARAGQVDSLMKGSLHTETFIRPIVDAEHGLVEERRLSHVFLMEVKDYPRPLFITDAAINIYPTLEEKRDIVQNAIDMVQIMGLTTPKVAILSAVEVVTSKIRSTVDAAALCKMADRGQITGGILDGPLAFDNAVSEKAAEVKGISSPVAGKADILLMPDMESGNILAKHLEFLGGGQGAGIVVGARVPVILTSRADDAMSRMASCALAVLLYSHRKQSIL
jgi:phosphate acetyltransferase